MKRNSTTIYIECLSFGIPSVEPVPWDEVNQVPIFDNYTESTRGVLWRSFHDQKDNIEIIPDIKPQPEIALPDWNGLYKSLMVTEVYQHLVGLSSTITAITSALDKSVDAIQYGIMRPDDTDAFTAFQSAINLLFYSLEAVEQALSPERLAQIRSALDSNGFEGITHVLFN